MTPADRRIALALFVVVFVAYAWFFGGGGWNQNVNFDVTRALVEKQTIRIDSFPPNTGDISIHEGRVYSNKAPGVSFLAVIPYAPLYAIERISGIDPSAPFVQIINLWSCTVLVCGLSGALLAAAFFVYARTRIGATPAAAAAVALILAFGTYVWAYSSVLFMHVPNTLLLFLAFVLAKERPTLAGACAGASVVCNYIAFPAALFLLALFTSWKAAARYIAGAAPFAVLLLGYQALAFGSPFRTSVADTSPAFLAKHHAFGVLSWPDPLVLMQILFGRFRGLFYLSPVLLLAFAGIVVMVRRRVLLRELAVLSAIVVSFILLNAGFNGWHGGAAIGPRYLMPIVPFLAIPMLYVASKLRAVWIALAVWSIFVNFAAVAVNPMPSPRIEDPVGSYLLPLLFTGRIALPTPGRPVYVSQIMLGHVSVNRNAPDEPASFTRHPRGSAISEWASFNVGETFAQGSLWSLLPVLLWIFGGAAYIRALISSGRHDQQSDRIAG